MEENKDLNEFVLGNGEAQRSQKDFE